VEISELVGEGGEVVVKRRVVGMEVAFRSAVEDLAFQGALEEAPVFGELVRDVLGGGHGLNFENVPRDGR